MRQAAKCRVGSVQLMPPDPGPHVEQRKLLVQFLFPRFSSQCSSAAVQYRLQSRLKRIQSHFRVIEVALRSLSWTLPPKKPSSRTELRIPHVSKGKMTHGQDWSHGLLFVAQCYEVIGVRGFSSSSSRGSSQQQQ